MKKAFYFLTALTLLTGTLGMPGAQAAVTVAAGPVSLIADPVLVKASSSPVGLFEFTLSADAGETLSSVSVIVNQANASTTVAGSDLAALALYKDDGNGNFDPSVDSLLGSQASVNVGGSTQVNVSATTTATGKFFVSLSTASSWSDAAPADSVTVTLPANGIVTSLGALATPAAVTTNTITADTTAPQLVQAVAKNSGGTSAKEAGDSVELTFSESTNKPAVNAANIASIFSLNNAHSFLDGAGALGDASWNAAGTVLTITLSASTSLPTVVAGDMVTVVNPSVVKDIAGNTAAGSQTISGSFSTTVNDEDQNEDEDEDDEDKGNKAHCANGLINGRLYKLPNDTTVYLVAACRLKPFRGEAVFKARGHKFQDVIELSVAPSSTAISLTPVLPAGGTLVKGSDSTVWFITLDKHRRGFVSANKFFLLGFNFNQVQQISDSDLALIALGAPIQENDEHPDGALVKCGNSPIVFQVIGSKKFPFVNAQAFLGRGHSWQHLANVDCGKFRYVVGAPIDSD